MGALDDLVNFGDISALTEDALDEVSACCV